jgi:hypothetical protein
MSHEEVRRREHDEIERDAEREGLDCTDIRMVGANDLADLDHEAIRNRTHAVEEKAG